ncbi:MAG: arginine N-succinyltransferase [Verrucomicrobiota bacterium]
MTEPAKKSGGPKFGCFQVLMIILVVMVITAGLTAWWVKRHLYATALKPVELTVVEEKKLDEKIETLESEVTFLDDAGRQEGEPDLRPAPGGDGDEEKRELEFTEREINGLLNRENPELGEKVYVDLMQDAASVRVIVPIEEDVPFLGGKTLRIKVNLSLSYGDNQLAASVRRVSLGGIPLPNAWLGNIKDKDLVSEFGEEGSFWKSFSDGIEGLEVQEDKIWVKLAE